LAVLAQGKRTVSFAESPPRRGSWFTTIPGSRPTFAGTYAISASRGWAASCATASSAVMPTTSGTRTSFGLQSAVVAGPCPEI
jgi:hypothetical protein